MGYLLKEALKMLCGVNQWSYAIFWKFGCQNPRLLIWEECFYENSGMSISELDFEDWSSSSTHSNNDHLGINRVHFLVTKMMLDNQINVVGEGLIGRAAFTGIHQWILSHNFNQETHPSEVLKEVFQQFSAGMQTIAVIPVLPHGVVQLGSNLPMMENATFVHDVKALILQLGCFPGVLLPENYESNETVPMILPANPCQTVDEMLPANSDIWLNHQPTCSYIPRPDFDSVVQEHVNRNCNFGTHQQDEAFVMGTNALDSLPEFGSCSNATPHSSRVSMKSFNDLLSDSVLKNERQEYRNHSVSGSDFIYEGINDSGNDLFDILGVDFKNKLLNQSWNNSQDNSGSESSITNSNKKKPDLLVSSQGQSCDFALPLKQKDHLLDAMISKSSSFSGPNVTSSSQVQAELSGLIKSTGKQDLFDSCSYKPDPYINCFRSSLYRSQTSSWIDDNMPSSSVSTDYSKKTDDSNKTNRKRLKPGENPRPRPKDRQMIQDRVKELREIVPNSAKCSIDSLLERTIKHMIFLQSVTKHADKLKQSGESKIFSKEGGLLNYDGGATWAYEVGSQSTVCPIVVEDLNQPRQMLVEMLCEESGLFLEIAEIIRGLGLTILKGVMEVQKDKIWARFAVEANRDVTRMEIFVSLVRLLDQNIKNGVPTVSECH